jgi:GT2 family glycosyltransferase
MEFLIIDDGSTPTLERIVRTEAPEATYTYFEQSEGQSKRRSEGFEKARGSFILQLDDDSFPVDPEALLKAVRFMEAHSEIGALSLQIFNGEHLPIDLPVLPSKYHSSFVGCGVFFRSEALRRIGGYRDFFGNEWEEEELGLRLMKDGWKIYFWPDVLIHHQLSPRNRLTERTWMRGFRNKLWAIVMHFPARRLFLEIAWVLAIAAMDAVRLLRFRSFVGGIMQFLGGIPRALRLRDPMSNIVLRRYDAMRFGVLKTEEEYNNPPQLGLKDFTIWFRNWLNRPRQRSFWDRRAGDTGSSATVKYAHEYKSGRRG